MMMHDLPLDLVEEILSRVPATSLKRLRCTCKRWNALFKDQSFTKKQFRKAPKESLLVMLNQYRAFSMSVNLSLSPPSIEFKGALDDLKVDIVKVSQCDGLLLCTIKDYRLVVWNPCSGEARWIEYKADDPTSVSRFYLGYENKESCRGYKILRRVLNGVDQISDPCVVSAEVYEFSSNSWRVLNDVDQITGLSYGCVTIKGNTYLRALNDEEIHLILCFDYTTKRFKRLSFPTSEHRIGWMDPSSVGEDRLSLMQMIGDYDERADVWLTSKIETSESALSWSKYFSISFYGGFVCTSVLVDEEKKVALCCSVSNEDQNIIYTIGEDHGYYKEIPLLEFTNNNLVKEPPQMRLYPYMFNYVPSLVQI